MHWQYTPYIIPLLITSLIAGTLTFWGWRRRSQPGANWFTAMMFSALSWALFYGLEMLSTGLEATLLWSKIQYFGAVSLSVMWLLLVLTYTGQRNWLIPRNIALLFVIPVITLILVWSNEFHELIWVNPGLDNNLAFNTLSFIPGVWWWVNVAYSYIIFIFTTILLIIALTRSAILYRRQIVVLLIFSSLTWVGNLAYTVGLTPHGMNLTPVTFSISGLLIAWGLFRYRMMDIAPVARDAIIDNMSEGLIVLDTQYRVVDINKVAQTILNQLQSDLIGEPIAQVLSAYPSLEILWQDVEDGNRHADITLDNDDIGYRSFDVRISPLQDRHGQVMGNLMFWYDITIRKEAEETLKLERNLMRTLIDNIPDLIYAKDIHGKFSLANIALAQLTGQANPNDLIGQDEFDTAPAEIAAQFMAVEQEILRTGKPSLNHVEPTVDSQGNLIWLSTTKVPLKNDNGAIAGIVGVSRDITEQRQAEEELRKLSLAVEQSGSTIVITDLEGNIEFTNPAFTNITRYSSAEALGQNTSVLNSGKHPSEFYQELWETITNGEVWHGEMINRKKDGELYWEAATISPVQNKNGEITHYLAVKEDVSKRKAIEKALAQEQQKTDALLKNMLPEEVANEIKQTGTVAPMLFENASILFTDFSNFTTTAEQLAPKELVDLVSHYFSFFDSVIEKYNLEKLKTIGDSYMCAGGLPTPNETHAIDIIHAALDILDFVQQEKENRQRQGLLYWDVRIGISSGSVVAGVIGQKKYAYDVWGDTVVMAARMESSGEVGKVNISRTTYNLVKDKFDCYYRGKITAKNKGQVEMYFVNGFKTRKTVNQ